MNLDQSVGRRMHLVIHAQFWIYRYADQFYAFDMLHTYCGLGILHMSYKAFHYRILTLRVDYGKIYYSYAYGVEFPVA